MNQHGEVGHSKGTLVALGNLQREGIDSLDTFSPTAVASSIRLVSTIVLELDGKLAHLDIQQNFVQSLLHEKIYLRLPQGYGDRSGLTVRLPRTLYSFRPSLKVFNKYSVWTLMKEGFDQFSGDDPCTFR